LRLNLGSGSKPKDGYLNVDLDGWPGVDEIVDLNVLPWPWEDDSVESVFAQDSLEHLCPLGRSMGQMNIIAIIQEIWRILLPGGVAELIVPSTDGRGAFMDPTHVTYWNANTFLYFLGMENGRELNYPQFIVPGLNFGVKAHRENETECVWVVARIKKPVGDEEDGRESTESGDSEGTGEDELRQPDGESG